MSFFDKWSRRRVLAALSRVLFSLVLLLPLAGCVRLTMDPSPQELMGFQADVLAAYDEAARLYDWFDLAPMPVDESDSVREGETTYFRVRDDGITSTEDLRSRLEEIWELSRQSLARLASIR